MTQGNKQRLKYGATTDAYTDNASVNDNTLVEDVPVNAFVWWGAVADPAIAFTNVERRTKRQRPNKLLAFAQNDGGNQVSEGRVIALGGTIASDGKGTRYVVNIAGPSDNNGYLYEAIPAGPFRSTPAIISASNTEFDASQLLGGAVNNKLTATQFVYHVVPDASRGNIVRLTAVVERN